MKPLAHAVSLACCLRSCMLCFLSLAAGLSLSGCSANFDQLAFGTPVSGAALHGTVYGGQQPVAGAHVYLFAAATTGYGAASVPLLTSGTAGTDTINGVATGYVTTDSNGFFKLYTGSGSNITLDYTCPTANSQVYLYVLGGNPGGGTNTVASFLSALGTCSNLANDSSIFVSEVSTVAAAYALAGFAVDATHIADDETVSANTTKTAAQTGMANAFAAVNNLVGLTTGAALATTPSANGGNGTVPQALLNTLANIEASCINTNGALTGPTSPSNCYTLLHSALSGGTTGTVPAETATAMINIAHNPAANVAALFGMPAPTPPFAPALASNAQPNDFTVGISFTGAGMASPRFIAVDASGDVWCTNFSSAAVSELSNMGYPLSGSGGYATGSSQASTGLAIDGSGNAWFTTGTNLLAELNSSGTAVSGSPYTVGTSSNAFIGIAIDGSGYVWVTDNISSGKVYKLNSSGTDASSGGYVLGSGSAPFAVAMDASGNAWVASISNNSVTGLSSTGAILSGTPIGANAPHAVAVDSSGAVWATASVGGLSKFIYSTTVSQVGSYPAVPGLPVYSVALDGSGHVWVDDYNSLTSQLSSISEFSNVGTLLSPSSTGYQGGAPYGSYGIVVDGSGNVWIAGVTNNTLTELVGAATPVLVPLQAAVAKNKIGSEP